ncbi:selenocysteine-specific translation elongation factor [Arsenicicoccus dermatophilus]|uniref:selenocysteine-specific translation elongation factor n=1 Tax=Arsenicicoccus dermatophilus TaxID=1076331 RepID=UPI001F4D1287|nr:selenocysteine-specific translation elongation factor [Arsenicicoccus dermatophilus]MCH8612964.1 selenocysteine-specific translation elongation factor [Arsenicicoccus dermatophilus]
MRHVVATAGHVDHGKSTLVRALTGMEPDRWAEERRRGMTIDLGFAWATLGSGDRLAFVDVPGHQRFIGNMLAGLGPAPAVLMVVAADEGWRRQSEEHLEAVDALGLRHGLLAVTRSDLADPTSALAEARERIARSSLGAVEAVAVSPVSGEGLDPLRAALERLVARLPAPDPTGRVRLWVDRAFTVAGAGTVVTGTLGSGTLSVGDELELCGRKVRVRGLQSLGEDLTTLPARGRVAVNLRAVATADVSRGSYLLTPGAWRLTRELDVQLGTGAAEELPGEVMVHVGAGAWAARVRPLGDRFVRLRLPEELPLQAGDRLILRDPGRQSVLGGATVLDSDPPALQRRGAARRRAEVLVDAREGVDVVAEVRRRGLMHPEDLAVLGADPDEVRGELAGVLRVGDWLVHEDRWAAGVAELRRLAMAREREHPMDPWLPLEQARRQLDLPDLTLVRSMADGAGLDSSEGRLGRRGLVPTLGDAEAGMCALEAQLGADPFAAPERWQLDEWGLGARELAAAEAAGRVVRLVDDIVLLPKAPALAMRSLAALPQPFTTSAARQTLGTTRRVVIPLLEHLDARGWTRRTDENHREVAR